ncbi:MAG TPA: AGE family epimerase/isomerase [Chitinophagaceae bacterium]|jgi:mannobiose 2-epimerase|nr:AGE family epimerase/isomerase [Chitinophagaceae bacterium]
MERTAQQWKGELEQELESLLGYWMQHAPDAVHGGFYGRIDHENRVHPEAPKGSVLHARILWTFSAAARHTGRADYRAIADCAYIYFTEQFIDRAYGGVYWSLDYKGAPLDAKKQVYAQSFAIYALSEYARCTGSDEALAEALALYQVVRRKGYDPEHGGYWEALTRDWQPIADMRLSAKDANEKKSMNTHLHVLEGFANLYRIAPREVLKADLQELVRLFLDHIIHPATHHLQLFFNEQWTPRSEIISYGHDIEAAWLVQEAAEVIADAELVAEVKARCLRVAEAAAEGLDRDGGLWYEKEGGHLVKEKHWWPQAEALVGFYNAYQVSGNPVHRRRAEDNWNFIRRHILHERGGEWKWGVYEDYSLMAHEDKAGFWKCPYHNGRACLELAVRLA